MTEQDKHANPVADRRPAHHLMENRMTQIDNVSAAMPSLNTDRLRVLLDISAERDRQHDAWGDQQLHADATWLAILTEEVGEAAQATLHDEFGGKASGTLYAEVVQVAAVATAWLEALHSRGSRTIGQVLQDGPR